MITIDDIHRLFEYDSETGYLMWKEQGKRRSPIANCIRRRKGLAAKHVVTLWDMEFNCNKITWMMFHGKIPDGLIINHIDGDRLNNRIENLELIKRAEILKARMHYKRTNTDEDDNFSDFFFVSDATRQRQRETNRQG